LSFVTDKHKTFQSHFRSPSLLKRIPFRTYFTITRKCSLHWYSDIWFWWF